MLGNDKEQAQGRRLMQASAEAGDPLAMGWMVDDLWDSDRAEAMAWLARSAEAGSIKAAVRLGVAYREGRGVTADPEQALHWFYTAALAGEAPALLDLAWLHERANGDLRRALFWYEQSAYANNHQAQQRLGRVFLYGTDGVARDHERAVHFLSMAAARGHRGSYYHLGLCYERGYGVDPDLVSAREMHEYAAQRGDYRSKTRYGRMLILGEGGEANPEEGRQWIEEAIADGHVQGQVELAHLLRQGDHLGQDLARALSLYAQAAEEGNDDAMLALGRMHRDGVGVPVDPARARRWFEQAVEAGSDAAAEELDALSGT